MIGASYKQGPGGTIDCNAHPVLLKHACMLDQKQKTWVIHKLCCRILAHTGTIFKIS